MEGQFNYRDLELESPFTDVQGENSSVEQQHFVTNDESNSSYIAEHNPLQAELDQLDSFVTASEEDFVASQVKPTRWLSIFKDAVPSFARPMVYGLQTFNAMVSAIKEAESSGHFIYILGWMLEDDFQLIPGEKGTTLFELLTNRPRQVEIRVVIWDNPDYRHSLQIISAKLNAHPNIKMYLDPFTPGTPDVQNALSALRSIIAGIPDEIKDMLQDNDKWKTVNTYKDQPNEGSHHEKILIVNGKNGLTAFCGGIDINKNRIGGFAQCGEPAHASCTPVDDFPNARKYVPIPIYQFDSGIPKPLEVLHDVHCQVKGHAAWKLLQKFHKRWHQVQTGKHGKAEKLISETSQIIEPGAASFTDPDTSYVKVVHTFNQTKGSPADLKYGPKTDRTIWDSITLAIRSAEKSIHIEDQYMLSVEIAGELNKKLTQDQKFKNGTITFLTQDDQYAGEDIPIIKRMRKEFMDTLMRGISPADPRVTVFILNKELSFPAHHKVHSKLYIIDRELVIIGSANCSRRSMTNDSETAAIIFNNEHNKNKVAESLERRYSRISKWIRYQPNPAVIDIDQKLLQMLSHPLAVMHLGGIAVVSPSFVPRLLTAVKNLPEVVRKIIDPFNNRFKDDMELEANSFNEHTMIEGENDFEGIAPFSSTEHYPENYFPESFAHNEQFYLNETINQLHEADEAEAIEEWIDYEDQEDGNPALQTEAPGLIKDETDVPGITIYVDINIGTANFPLRKTGIYIPPAFNPDHPADILLYLHGMTTSFPGSHAQIDDYWKAVRLPSYDLRIRESVHESGKNIILVAPSLGKSPNAYLNSLSGKPGGLDLFMQAITSAIRQYVAIKKFNKSHFATGNLILVAHSAGGSQMFRIASWKNPVYGPKITECWGFDSLYGGVYNWMDWAKRNSDKKLFIYFKSSTAENALRLKDKSRHLPNIFVKRSDAMNHFWVVKAHLKERILHLSGAVNKADFEEEASEEIIYEALHEHGFEEAFNCEHDDESADVATESIQDYLFDSENYVSNLSKAVALNRSYSISLGWNKYHTQINDMLLPLSGQQNVSLGEEAFAQAVAVWQLSKGMSSKDADGIIGPKTWQLMQPLLMGAQSTGTSAASVPTGNAQSEWSGNSTLQSRYPTWQAYDGIRRQVIQWKVSDPMPFIEEAIREWNANPGVHTHFGKNFDTGAEKSYLYLRRLYRAKGYPDPAGFIAANIITISFFNRKTPAHRNLQAALQRAESALRAQGISYNFTTAWSFVPRIIAGKPESLSNHSFGKAIDIDWATNPHITSTDVIKVINAVCSAQLPKGLLAEKNPDTFRSASNHFKQTFNDAWVSQQTQPDLKAAISRSRSTLNKYASGGFFDLPTPLVYALKNAGCTWGGDWLKTKDFMHFEVT